MELLQQPLFWSAYLRQVTGGPISKIDLGSADAAFGWTSEQIDEFDARYLSDEGTWPRFRVPLRSGASIEIEYVNIPEEYEFIYRVEHPSWKQGIDLGRGIAHWFLPAFRWTELIDFSRDVSTNPTCGVTPEEALLLLLPTAWLSPSDNADDVRQRLSDACGRVNLGPQARTQAVVQSLASAMQSQVRWQRHERYGWINDEEHSRRNAEASHRLTDQEFDALLSVFKALRR
jgi:hypothetical protein